MDSSPVISIAIGIRDAAAVCPRRRLGGGGDFSMNGSGGGLSININLSGVLSMKIEFSWIGIGNA